MNLKKILLGAVLAGVISGSVIYGTRGTRKVGQEIYMEGVLYGIELQKDVYENVQKLNEIKEEKDRKRKIIRERAPGTLYI